MLLLFSVVRTDAVRNSRKYSSFPGSSKYPVRCLNVNSSLRICYLPHKVFKCKLVTMDTQSTPQRNDYRRRDAIQFYMFFTKCYITKINKICIINCLFQSGIINYRLIETHYHNLLWIAVSNTHLCLSPFCVSEALCRFRHVAWAAWAIAILRALAKKVLTGYDYKQEGLHHQHRETTEVLPDWGEVGVPKKQTNKKMNKERLRTNNIWLSPQFYSQTFFQNWN